MLGGTRAQTETIGTLLLTGIVIVATLLVGTMLLTRQSEQIRTQQDPAEFETDINGTSLVVTHVGGREIPLADLDLVLRQGETEQRYDLEDPGDRSGADLNGNADFESSESVTVSHSFTGEVRVLLVETATNGVVLYDETREVKASEASVSPTIEKFEINDTSSGGDASFDVTWNASDDQGDITQVTVELVNDGTVEDTATTSFSEVATTGENTDTLTNASGGGIVYKIRVTVTDAAGNTATESTGDTADSNIGLRPPTIEKFTVTDTTTGQDASYDVTYNASDPDDDIFEAEVELVDESSGTVVDSVNNSYNQVSTTGETTVSLGDPGGTDNTYHINLTVTDSAGNDVRDNTTDTAKPSGGSGTPPGQGGDNPGNSGNNPGNSGSGPPNRISPVFHFAMVITVWKTIPG